MRSPKNDQFNGHKIVLNSWNTQFPMICLIKDGGALSGEKFIQRRISPQFSFSELREDGNLTSLGVLI